MTKLVFVIRHSCFVIALIRVVVEPMTDPEPNETPGDGQKAPRLPVGLHFWWSAYLGTATAGGVFGALLLLIGGRPSAMPLGLLFGILFAGAAAIPIHITVAIMTWMLWLSRFRVISAGIAGGTTGVVAAGLLSDDIFTSPAVFWAGVLGLTGSAAAGAWTNRICRKLPKTDSDNPVWQFTLRDLFWRMTVFAMLVGTWTWAVRSIYDAR